MARYHVTGIDEETGVETTDSVKADSPEEARESARRHGIRPEFVELQSDGHDAPNAHAYPAGLAEVGLSDDRSQKRHEPHAEILPEEVIEKTSPTVRPRVMLGWTLLLAGIPLMLWVGDWLAMAMGLAGVPASIMIAAFGIAALIAGVACFVPYWKR